MKLNNIVFPLTLALLAALAATGCKHGPNGNLTDVPGQRIRVPAPPMPETKPIVSEPMPFAVPNTNPPVQAWTNGPIATATNWSPGDMNLDRDKLAAYTVHFKFDSSVVQDSEQAHVASVGQALSADATAKLLIEGHCDERGTEEYNRALGERRALALREALAKLGIDPMRIRTISYGKDQPVDPGHDETAYAKNRRGQFIYCTPKAPVQ